MTTSSSVIELETSAREQMLDITARVRQAAGNSGISDGIVLVASQHTTAGITVQENADPDVEHDIIAHLRTLVPRDAGFRHREGNSDAHLKVSLVGCSQGLPLAGGELMLGTWQGIYFCDFDGPRRRRVTVTVVG